MALLSLLYGSSLVTRSSKQTQSHCVSLILRQFLAVSITVRNLLLDDGAIRVWRNYVGNEGSRLELVTAWQALSGMIPSTRGLYPSI